MAAVDLTALPVSLDLPRALRDEVQRHLEAALGWQVTGAGDLPARLHLHAVGRPAATIPSVLLVTATDDPGAAATTALGADAVLRWPEDAHELATIAAGRLVSAPPRRAPTLRVGGSAGGVGTTTVSLALAGLIAGRGLDVLVVSCSDVPVPGVPEVATLRGPRPWEAAVPVPGVPGLRALRTIPSAPAELDGADLVVDDRPSAAPHLLVVGVDRVGRGAVAAADVGAVVVVARGPLSPADLAAAAGSRLGAILPWSHRVARAGLHQRVPSSLPGSYVAGLATLADRIARDLARRGGDAARSED